MHSNCFSNVAALLSLLVRLAFLAGLCSLFAVQALTKEVASEAPHLSVFLHHQGSVIHSNTTILLSIISLLTVVDLSFVLLLLAVEPELVGIQVARCWLLSNTPHFHSCSTSTKRRTTVPQRRHMDA